LSVSGKIVPFEPRFSPAFEKLNRRWIEELFEIEKEDLLILQHPADYVMARGGEIFFALVEDEAVGCVAMTPRGRGHVELSKMAVDPAHQGQGHGRRLLEAALAWARDVGMQRVSLQSSSKLPNALALYEKMGFGITRRGPHPDYARTDIVMEMSIRKA
jgi:GNAT superfamily N-acetyltransferase